MEYKFRGWDNEKSVMIYNPIIDFERKRFDVNRRETKEICGTNITCVVYEDIKYLMQYTGINDCKRTEEYPNGQEIYVGDIVREYDESCNVDEKRCYKVVFEDCGYKLYNLSKAFMLWTSRYSELFNGSYEVVGNIYQNKED